MSSKPAPERVANKVRELAKAARIEQSTLARALHISQQSVSRKLSGETPFRLEELDAVADALHVEPETLIARNTKA